MTDQELEQKIKERQKEGRALFHPSKLIACKLGKTYPKNHGAIQKYEDAIITISYDTYAPNLSVYCNNESVLNFHLGTLMLYRPSNWVKHLKELAEPLLIAEQANKRVEEQERERKRLYNWGFE